MCLALRCDPLRCCTGVLDESIRDAGLVALSFLRAHGGLLDERYGLYMDPRVRHAQDWILGLSPVAIRISGSSIGAAIAGTLWCKVPDSSTERYQSQPRCSPLQHGVPRIIRPFRSVMTDMTSPDPVRSSYGLLLHPSKSTSASLRHGRGVHFRSVMLMLSLSARPVQVIYPTEIYVDCMDAPLVSQVYHIWV